MSTGYTGGQARQGTQPNSKELSLSGVRLAGAVGILLSFGDNRCQLPTDTDAHALACCTQRDLLAIAEASLRAWPASSRTSPRTPGASTATEAVPERATA
jgi:hypothetical protein